MARFVLDSGATCNIMCASEYEKRKPKPDLSMSRVNLYHWGANTPVANLGKFPATLTYHDSSLREEIHVLK